MVPIKVGIIGLSSKPDTWAAKAHLHYLLRSPKYQIVALCNSSVANAKAAILAHGLPATTKAYALPGDFAADANIDLFVISTRVDTHCDLAKPVLLAGKDVFIEWPLAANTAQARELVELAQQSGVKTMIGLQGRVSPSVLKVKEVVGKGRLGTIHSVNIQATSGAWQNNMASNRYAHFLTSAVGGNLLTIYGIHILDSAFSALNELTPGCYTARYANLRRKMWLDSQDGSQQERHLTAKDTPDQILLQGTLEMQEFPAPISLHLRAGDRFKDIPGSTWRIYGEKAEMVVEFASAGPQIGQASSIKVFDFETKELTEVPVDNGGSQWTELPTPGQNIGRLYEAFAAGEDYPDWELALRRHELLDDFVDFEDLRRKCLQTLTACNGPSS